MSTEFNDVTNPAHYQGAGVDCKTAMYSMLNNPGIKSMAPSDAYWWGCAFKYMWRFPLKNGVQDIDKAIECLTILKEQMYGAE